MVNGTDALALPPIRSILFTDTQASALILGQESPLDPLVHSNFILKIEMGVQAVNPVAEARTFVYLSASF